MINPVQIAQIVVLIFGCMVILVCFWGIYSPQRLLDLVRGVMDGSAGFPAAVVVRLGLGLALILSAESSRIPHVFQILGWIAIVAALGLLFLGRMRLRRFIAWFDRFSATLIRLWLLLGIGFGGVMVYGALW